MFLNEIWQILKFIWKKKAWEQQQNYFKYRKGRHYNIPEHNILVIRQKYNSNRIDSAETDIHIYGNLVYGKSVFSN